MDRIAKLQSAGISAGDAAAILQSGAKAFIDWSKAQRVTPGGYRQLAWSDEQDYTVPIVPLSSEPLTEAEVSNLVHADPKSREHNTGSTLRYDGGKQFKSYDPEIGIAVITYITMLTD